MGKHITQRVDAPNSIPIGFDIQGDLKKKHNPSEIVMEIVMEVMEVKQ